jgi:hypothetical protein
MASFLLDASYALAEPITAVQFTTGGSEATSNETRGFDFSLSGPITLAAGSHVIGGLTDLSDRNLREIPTADVTFASGLTFGGSVTNDVIGTFSEPTTQTPNLDVGYFGPNFQFTAAVAEPSTWAMMLLGFAGLGFAARRRWGAAVRAAA